MQVFVEHIGDVQFQIKARQHTIPCDQPVENGGYDEGMTPPELFLASLGSCVAYYAAQFLRKRMLAAEGTMVRVTAEKAKDPARLDNIEIDLILPISLSVEETEGIKSASLHCLIHNTLLHPPRVSLQVQRSVVMSN